MKHQLTGKIRQDGHIIVFTSIEFGFTFVRVDDYKDTKGHYSKLILRPDKAGYIWGMTSERKVIAIYIKEDREIYHSLIVDTWNYIIFRGSPYGITDGTDDHSIMIDSASLMSRDSDELSRLFHFAGIEFRNGFVRSVNPCHALKEDFDLESEIIDREKDVNSELDHGVLVYKIINDKKTNR